MSSIDLNAEIVQNLSSENEGETHPTELKFDKKISSTYLLKKNTESFRCLAQVLMSNSLLLDVILNFPPLLDPGIDKAFNTVESDDAVDNVGIEKYKKWCKDLKIVPISRIIKSLTSDTLDLKYYGLTLNQVKALAQSLKINQYVKELVLQDNWLTPEATQLIGDVLLENNSIQKLSLRECRIGNEGAVLLAEGISMSHFLEEIDLSFNSLGNEGIVSLQAGLIENTTIKKLNLSHNGLSEDSGVILQKILEENKVLEELDLSWNEFFTGPGNKSLFMGMARNESIKSLNLAWNGIGSALAMRPISKWLRKSTIIQFLDLSNNRIAKQSLRLLRNALSANSSLLKTRLGNNTYSGEEAQLLAMVLLSSKKSPMREMDLENMCVFKPFLLLKARIFGMGKRITHGHVICNYDIRGANVIELLFKRCRFLTMKPKKKKARKDFGHLVLGLPDKKLTKTDFEMYLKSKKVKMLDKDLISELLSKFSTKTQKIDCELLKNSYMTLYPDTALPEVKKKKKGKGGKAKKKKKHKEKIVENLDGNNKEEVAVGAEKGIEETTTNNEINV